MDSRQLYNLVLQEYNSSFNEDERQRMSDSRCDKDYSVDNLRHAKTYDKKPFFPSMIKPHIFLKTSRYQVFNIHHVRDNEFFERQYVNIEKEIVKSYLDIVQLYWLGYLAFLSELSEESTLFQLFIEKYRSLSPYKFTDEDHLITYDNCGFRLKDENFEEFLKSFIVYFSLETCFVTSVNLNTESRVKALKIWQKYDSDYKLYTFKGCLYDGYYDNKIKNILPQSFAPELDPSKSYGVEMLRNNKTFTKIFDPLFDFKTGLNMLTIKYQAETIQICRSLLNFSQLRDTKAHRLVLNFLKELITYDDRTLELYFGEHTSYRNKGRVTKYFDKLSQMDRGLLERVAREQKRKIKDLKESLDTERRKTKEKIKEEIAVNHRLRQMINEKRNHLKYSLYFNLFAICYICFK